MSVAVDQVPNCAADDDPPDAIVVVGMHDIVAGGVLVEVLAIGQWVWAPYSCFVLGVVSDKM